MTENKPIMIDGVDVSGCEYWHHDTNSCGEYKCEDYPDCNFKQLTRKTQECEELKKDIERWKSNFNGKVSAIEELLQQLDQLKADINKKELIFAGIEVSNRELIKELNQLKASKEQTEQKLKKIEKIAKDFHYAIIPFHRGINHEMADRIDYYLNQILQIIDEVE